MDLRIALLLCATGAVAACSHDSQPASTAVDSPPTVASADAIATVTAPAGEAAPSTPSPRPEARDARAPLVADAEHRRVAEPTSGAAPSNAAQESAPSEQGAAPDNTKVNQRDRDARALTPLDQGENRSDLEITRSIRKAVMADSSLSFTAKNVKIITRDGTVTLRGPVKNAAERSAIEAAAHQVAGVTQVDNQLEIAK